MSWLLDLENQERAKLAVLAVTVLCEQRLSTPDAGQVDSSTWLAALLATYLLERAHAFYSLQRYVRHREAIADRGLQLMQYICLVLYLV